MDEMEMEMHLQPATCLLCSHNTWVWREQLPACAGWRAFGKLVWIISLLAKGKTGSIIVSCRSSVALVSRTLAEIPDGLFQEVNGLWTTYVCRNDVIAGFHTLTPQKKWIHCNTGWANPQGQGLSSAATTQLPSHPISAELGN